MGRVKGKPTGAVKCPNHSHCRDPVPIPGAEDQGWRGSLTHLKGWAERKREKLSFSFCQGLVPQMLLSVP